MVLSFAYNQAHDFSNSNEVTLKGVDKIEQIEQTIELQQNPKQFVLQWRHNERDGVSNHQPQDCLLNRLFKA